MSKKAFEQKIREIEHLRATPGPETSRQLTKFLANRNNYLVSKAAAVAGDTGQSELVPDLVKAFQRFLENAVKADPQCWAKTALAKALKELGHREPEVFLQGMAHIQMEPVFGGRQDTAGPLRSISALALVDCKIDALDALGLFGDLLLDNEPGVRGDAAIAIEQLGHPGGVPLLRLKARVGDAEPDVTGQCLFSLVRMAGPKAVPFVEKFLSHDDGNVAIEAATVLGAAPDPEALAALTRHYRLEPDPRLRRAMVTAAGASPVPDALEFLLRVVEEADQHLALAAIEALAASRFRNESREKVVAAVKSRGDERLEEQFHESFGE